MNMDGKKIKPAKPIISEDTDVWMNSIVDLNWSKANSTSWEEIRRSNLLCDGALKSDDGATVPVHKALLAACSSVFRAAFSAPLGQEIDIMNVDCSERTLQLILDYLYSYNCNLDEESAKDVFVASGIYLLCDLHLYCTNFLVSCINDSNCIELLHLSKMMNSDFLTMKSLLHILQKFESIHRTNEEFFKLTAEEMEELLDHDLLNVADEVALEDVIKQWYVKNSTLPELPDFSKCIRIIELEDWPRAPYEVIVTTGGFCREKLLRYIESYDPRSEHWLVWNSDGLIDFSCVYHSLVFLEGYLYILGGYNGTIYLSDVNQYDHVAKTWTSVSHMLMRRGYLAAVVLDGQIYALGGHCGSQKRLRSCERYDPIRNQWSFIAPMSYRRSDASAAVLDGKIYIAGGFSGDSIQTSVECYDSYFDVWYVFVHLLDPRSGLQLLAYHDRLFAIGGYNGTSRIPSVESIAKDSVYWRNEAPMLQPRSNFGAVVFQDRIWVMGGYDQGTFQYTESFGSDEVWRFETSMNSEKACFPAVVIRGLHATTFSYKRNRSQQTLFSDTDYYEEDYEMSSL